MQSSALVPAQTARRNSHGQQGALPMFQLLHNNNYDDLDSDCFHIRNVYQLNIPYLDKCTSTCRSLAARPPQGTKLARSGMQIPKRYKAKMMLHDLSTLLGYYTSNHCMIQWFKSNTAQDNPGFVLHTLALADPHSSATFSSTIDISPQSRHNYNHNHNHKQQQWHNQAPTQHSSTARSCPLQSFIASLAPHPTDHPLHKHHPHKHHPHKQEKRYHTTQQHPLSSPPIAAVASSTQITPP